MAQIPCSGLLLRRALLLTGIASALASGQSEHGPVGKKAAAHRANELMLAGLRPGVDKGKKAETLYRKWLSVPMDKEGQLVWQDGCRGQMLAIDVDAAKKVQVLRLSKSFQVGDCKSKGLTPWRTGHGLQIGDSAPKAIALYGEPDSRSPSTRDGQPLELLYYQFDWAGADVPQVMEVLCTKKDGELSRVVEITLAAPSL